MQQYGTVVGRHAGPVALGKSFLGGLDGDVHVCGLTFGHLSQHGTVAGVQRLKCRSIGGLDPLATDVHPDRSVGEKRCNVRKKIFRYSHDAPFPKERFLPIYL